MSKGIQFDLAPHRPVIRRMRDAGASPEDIAAAVGWSGTADTFIEAVKRQLQMRFDFRRRTHTGGTRTAQRIAETR